MKTALMVLSGGMDSVTMLHEYASMIAEAVTFNYGSNHNAREIECARLNCNELGIPLTVIDLAFIGQYFESSLLRGADAIPEGGYAEENIHSTVVPFRNGIMLSVAAGLAESRGLDTVMLANHAGDHVIYADCRPSFVSAMDKAICEGTFAGVRLSAPYTDLTKAEIAAHGRDLGIDYSKTYSCYKGGEHHCGRCATCIERREALAAAGITDTTTYDN